MDIDKLLDEYEGNGSNCCGARIIGEAWCSSCHEACQTFDDFVASYADYMASE